MKITNLKEYVDAVDEVKFHNSGNRKKELNPERSKYINDLQKEIEVFEKHISRLLCAGR